MSIRFIGVLGALATTDCDWDHHAPWTRGGLALSDDVLPNAYFRTARRVVPWIPRGAFPE